MSRILITSIGSGKWNKEKQRYQYDETEYSIGERRVRSSHIIDALMKLREYDKIIILGTAGSVWGLLYEYLCDTNGIEIDFDYVDELDALLASPNKKDLDVSDVRARLDKLKAAFGKSLAEIVVMKYGLNDEEHIANFELMTRIAEHIQDGDSLTFDITHSFRSLAFYELLAVSYIKETLGKRVTLDFVSYGMFEISRETAESTPIVDLSILTRMTDWLKAAEEYRRNGTTALLAELLETNDVGIRLSNEEKKALKRLGGDAISTNDLSEFKNLVKNCRNVNKAIDNGKLKNVAFDYIFSDIAKRFGDKLDDDLHLQAELAMWHFEKKRYIAAAITLVEATLDYCAKRTGLTKDAVRGKICNIHSPNGNPAIGDFRERYYNVRKLRNKLAHDEPLSPAEVKSLKKAIPAFHSTYKQLFKEIPDNEKALVAAFGVAVSSKSDDIDS